MRHPVAILLCAVLISGCREVPPQANSVDTDAVATSNSDPKTLTSKLPLRFSKTKELVLSMGSMKFMLDLDTDQTMDPPATPRPQQKQMDVYPNQIQPYQVPAELVGRSLQGLQVKSADWHASVTDVRNALARKKLQPMSRMAYDPAEPATFFFRTREGTDGILQIIDLTQEPKGILIRYKTVQH